MCVCVCVTHTRTTNSHLLHNLDILIYSTSSTEFAIMCQYQAQINPDFGTSSLWQYEFPFVLLLLSLHVTFSDIIYSSYERNDEYDNLKK